MTETKDDIIAISDSHTLQSYLKAYIQKVSHLHHESPKSNFHIFPAEVNANSYESEIPQHLGSERRPLHPRVVALLEDKERFELFFHAYALGFIQPNNKSSAPYWLYQLPTDKEPIYLTFPDSSLDKSVHFDPFKIIHNFVDLGIVQRLESLRRVDWESLKKALIASKRKLGKTAFVNLYQYQIDNSQGLVRIILKTTPNRHSEAENENSLISNEYEDLAEVAKFIFLKAIQELEQQVDGE